MAKNIAIERPGGNITIVRSLLESASEAPLTEHEQIINELFLKLQEKPEESLNMALLEKTMKEYGAIPTDWRHFFDDLRKVMSTQSLFDYSIIVKQSEPVKRLKQLPDDCVQIVLKDVIDNPEIEEQLKHTPLYIEFKYNPYQFHLTLEEYRVLQVYKKQKAG